MRHLMFYGSNRKRMGVPGVAQFSSGVENRHASVRIPFCVSASAGGYYEDRRPASNMDPYLVTMVLVCTTQRIPLPVEVRTLPLCPSHPLFSLCVSVFCSCLCVYVLKGVLAFV